MWARRRRRCRPRRCWTTAVPSGYTVTPDESVVGSTAAAANAGFTINAPADYVTNGYTYNWSVTDEVGNPPAAVAGPTGSGTITSTSQDVSVSLTGLPDGIVTYSVTLTDPSSGNVGAAATATTTLATSAPTGFTVTPDESVYNSTDVHSAGFTIQNANPGEKYSYTITDSADNDLGHRRRHHARCGPRRGIRHRRRWTWAARSPARSLSA